jgi:magnesium chelatase family protein
LQRKPSDSVERSAAVRERVMAARERQRWRFAQHGIQTNKEMSVKLIDQFCPLDKTSGMLLRQATEKMGLSARAYHRTIKVARTIADLAGEKAIKAEHVAEALQYRMGKPNA